MAITQATALADFSTGIGTAGAALKVDNVESFGNIPRLKEKNV